MLHSPPGPRSLELSHRIRQAEAPGINTLYRDQPSILWQEARGANVLDVDGNRFVDFTSGFGVASIGHRHPDVVQALRRQSGRLIHGLGDAMGHPYRLDLAERLIEIAPIEDAQVYFAVSGADAVEIAIKTSILSSGRPGILAFEPAYHGLTLGALAATSRSLFRQPFDQNLQPFVQRLPYACEPSAIESALRETPEIGGLLLEPIAGREGVLFPPPGWLRRVAEVCHQNEVLLLVDEVFTGFGRTGHRFAVEAENVRPDLLCCGKALAGGLPIGVVLGRRDVLSSWSTPGEARHTATFVANPLTCAAALASLEVLQRDRLSERARDLGEEIRPRLLHWTQRFETLSDVRGHGLLWGLEFHRAEAAGRFTQAAHRRGVLLLAGGPEGRVAQLVPPLTIHRTQLLKSLELLEESLEETQNS